MPEVDSDSETGPLPWRGLDVGSPFEYEKQAILYVAKHLPPPHRDGLGQKIGRRGPARQYTGVPVIRSGRRRLCVRPPLLVEPLLVRERKTKHGFDLPECEEDSIGVSVLQVQYSNRYLPEPGCDCTSGSRGR